VDIAAQNTANVPYLDDPLRPGVEDGGPGGGVNVNVNNPSVVHFDVGWFGVDATGERIENNY
jgi:hypothetical protein